MINQYYCIIFLQNEYCLISFFLSPSLFSEHLIRHYKVDFKNLLLFHDYLLRSNFHGNLFWHRKILSSYFLLLNLSCIVRFSQNMTVLQLAVISLILLSLIVCQTLHYDVDSLFLYYFVQDMKCLNMSNDKSIFFNDLGCLFLPTILGNLYYLIACLNIH